MKPTSFFIMSLLPFVVVYFLNLFLPSFCFHFFIIPSALFVFSFLASVSLTIIYDTFTQQVHLRHVHIIAIDKQSPLLDFLHVLGS